MAFATRVSRRHTGSVLLSHDGFKRLEVLFYLRIGGDLPQRRFPRAQAQRRRDPGGAPAGFDAPGAPADVGGAGPVVPLAEVERAEPRAVEVGDLRRADL